MNGVENRYFPPADNIFLFSEDDTCYDWWTLQCLRFRYGHSRWPGTSQFYTGCFSPFFPDPPTTSLWTDFVRAAAKKSSLLSHLHVFCRSGNVWVKNAAIFTETGVSTGIPCLDLSILTNGLLRWQTRGTYYTFKGEVLCCAIFVDDRSAVSLIPFLATTFTELCQSSFCFRHDLSNNATLKQHCWFNVVQIFCVYLN